MRVSKGVIDILKAIAIAGGVSAAIVIPNAGIALKAVFDLEKKSVKRRQFPSQMARLQKEGILRLGKETVTLTMRGKELLAIVSLDQLKIVATKWDKTWRVVTYDIPTTKNKYRDLFRKAIQHIGFVQIQKSVFVFPFECREEIAIVAHTCHVSSFVLYMHAQDIPDELQMKKHFALNAQ